MTCDRCKDIHKAQEEGKTQNKCECSCHDNDYITTIGTGNITLTNSDNAGVWTNFTGATTLNYNTQQFDPTAGAVDVTLNYGECKCCGGYHG